MTKRVQIKGTVKDLEALTGYNQVQLSILLKIASEQGKARIVDTVKTGKKGRTASIWEVDKHLKVSLGE